MQIIKKCFHFFGSALLLVCLTAEIVSAQTNEFTYQGKLSDSGTASAAYDFEFRLCDAAADCPTPLETMQRTGVAVSGGVFTVKLNFDAANFDGSNRWLEIAVKRPEQSGFTTLLPRAPVTSAPYAIRSLNATNATQFDGFTIGDFIQNTTTQQTANFNISGNGTTGGTLSGSVVNSDTQFNIGSSRILGLGGADSLFAGIGAGGNTTSNANSFFGTSAGFNNTLGEANSFFGRSAGFQNTLGISNAFFGAQAGRDNSTGTQNSFFGRAAGIGSTTGIDNSFFGAYAGQGNAGGNSNSFFGVSAGFNNTGNSNSFFGRSSGFQNTTGHDNSFFGTQAGRDNSTGYENSFFGKATGISNTVGVFNSFFGAGAGRFNTTGGGNAFFGRDAGQANTTGMNNAFFGDTAGYFNTTSFGNSFFGSVAGFANTTGNDNSFFGAGSGNFNNTGFNNSFVGAGAGYFNTTGNGNSFVGYEAGRANSTGNNNTIIGNNANVSGGNLSFATAVGANAVVNSNNSVVLGRSVDTVRIPGNLVVTGTVSKGGGSFRIDHPLDPENKYLYHSFVESPDMMNIYNGNTTTDERGEAVVTLPDYFDALNRDFRYQLTVIGQFAQAIVGEEIKGNSFVIRTDKPGVKVSWQVTGIRKDKFANENRIQVEVEKTEQERNEQKPQREKERCRV